MNSRISDLVKEVETTTRKAESAGNKAEKRYIVNFHLAEAYQSFANYWRGHAYTEVVEWIEANLQIVNTSRLRAEFLKEGVEAQTLTEGSQVIGIEDKAKVEADVGKVAPNAIVLFVPPPSLPVYFFLLFVIFAFEALNVLFFQLLMTIPQLFVYFFVYQPHVINNFALCICVMLFIQHLRSISSLVVSFIMPCT